MKHELPNSISRRVSTLVLISAVLLFACVIAILVQARRVAQERLSCASGLSRFMEGAGVEFADANSAEGGSIPWSRRLMGDRAALEVKLPFDAPDYLRTGVAALFPDAVRIVTMPGEPLVAKMFGGTSALSIVLAPDHVETCKLVDSDESQRADVSVRPNPREAKLATFSVLGEMVVVPKELSAQLVSRLMSPDSYEWYTTRMCNVYFRDRLSFIRGQERIDILFDFECNSVLVFYNGLGVGDGQLINETAECIAGLLSKA